MPDTATSPLDTALDHVRHINPDAALTLKSLAEINNGNIRDAQSDFAKEDPSKTKTGVDPIDQLVEAGRARVNAAFVKGDVALLKTAEVDMLNTQMAASGLMELFKQKMAHTEGQANEVLDNIKAFAGQDGANALMRLSEDNLKTNGVEKTSPTDRANAQKDQPEAIKALGVQFTKAINAAVADGHGITGGEQPTAAPTAPKAVPQQPVQKNGVGGPG